MDTTLLKEAGLTEGEAKVYLALLELGPSTTGPIVECSGVAKSIIYQILEKLAKKGLASHIVKEKTKHFQAAQPDRLMDYVDEREKTLSETKKKLGGFLPKLSALQQSAKPDEARVYLGFKGMISVHERTYEKLKKGEEYFYIGGPPSQTEVVHSYWKRDHLRREKTGIKCRILFHPKMDRKEVANRNTYAGCDARYMPLEINSPVWLLGYKDVIAMQVLAKNPITIEITNQEIADSFRAYFEEFWKKSRHFK